MKEVRPHLWKIALILVLYGLAGRWDYEDSQRLAAQQNWARVAQK